MIFIYGNARSYFVTAPKEMTVKAALARYFKKGDVAYLSAVSAGGVWNGTRRVKSEDEILPSGQTLKVYISPTQGLKYHLADDAVVAETKDYIIVVKPAGLSTVPDRACDQFNLTAAVGSYLKRNGSRYVPTAISRLDLMVQGIVMFPKHKDAEKTLFAMMQHHRIRKLYRATVAPSVRHPVAVRPYRSVDFPLEFGKKGMITPAGKPSRTIFLTSGSDGTQFSVIPITGRRHQIRVHASATVGPIVGDTIYGGPPADRIHLAAVGLNFVWARKKVRIRYEGPFPAPLRMDDGKIVGEGVSEY